MYHLNVLPLVGLSLLENKRWKVGKQEKSKAGKQEGEAGTGRTLWIMVVCSCSKSIIL